MAEAVLGFEGIGFSRDERAILTDVSWEVQAGQIAAIIGSNGCGKSTLLRIGCAYLWPLEGTVRLLGETLGEVPVAPLRARIGLVEANAVYPFDEDMTALDVAVSGYFSALTLGYIYPTREQFDHARHLLEQVGLGSRAKQLYVTLSTGQRMRTLIARALVRRPEVLLLDEPTAALDLPAREAVLATLSRLHKAAEKDGKSPAIVMVTHHLEELLPGTENVLLLSNDGRVVAKGSPEKVLTSATLSETYGVPVQVSQLNGRYHAHVDPGLWEELI
jgi:iron complex transport system ATP-binding protein